MTERTNTAIWSDKRERWEITVKRNGQRKQFYSAKPGRSGQRECNKKADLWLSGTTNLNATCAQMAEQWITEVKATTSHGNFRQLASNLNTWILPAWGRKKVSALTVQDCKNILTAAHVAGKSYKTIHNIRYCITAFLSYCRDNEATSLHPENLRIPRDAPKSKKSVLQPDQLTTLFTSDETIYRNKPCSDWHIHLYRFAVVTGLRPGELIALKQSDISGVHLSVRGSIDYNNNPTPGKNKNAQRTFALTPTMLKILADQQEMLRAAGVISPYVFPYFDGDHVTQCTLERAWRRYREHHGFADITLYELRHTFRSINKNMPLSLVKMMMGHGDDMDTDGIYGHMIEGDMDLCARYVEDNLARYLHPNA